MRVLFGAWPAYGHLLPMVPLIRPQADVLPHCLPQSTDQPSTTAALLPTGAALALPTRCSPA